MSKVQLKEVVEPDFMAELGYVQSVQANKNKEIKSNTKMNYTQIKYALQPQSMRPGTGGAERVAKVLRHSQCSSAIKKTST